MRDEHRRALGEVFRCDARDVSLEVARRLIGKRSPFRCIRFFRLDASRIGCSLSTKTPRWKGHVSSSLIRDRRGRSYLPLNRTPRTERRLVSDVADR